MLRAFLGQHLTRLVWHIRFMRKVLSSSRCASVITGSSIVNSLHVCFFLHLVVDQLWRLSFGEIFFENLGDARLLAEGLKTGRLCAGHRVIARYPLVEIFLRFSDSSWTLLFSSG